MGIFHIALILAAFLCSLTAGILFAFAIIVMPGIAKLKDGDFLRAFQVMDRIIQDNHPLFMLVWVGSVLSLLVAAFLGFGQLDSTGRILIIIVTLIYVLGVQLPTVTINIPLNNNLQTLDIGTMDETAHKAARTEFEARWNRSNSIRTAMACLVSVMVLLLLLIL
ncbi:MAG: DUF1772 domain-containing protein [Chloroflexi bacterium]|nr:MAG: DUF1772 domain-containing protein [Chloroflexota bacterium]MBL1196582.1 DUF1772 domain-containing protein [Chloroflexota bacterium]NOH13877.1 DUF1772 domain-containing protein [Chloroflexota bacterium]